MRLYTTKVACLYHKEGFLVLVPKGLGDEFYADSY